MRFLCCLSVTGLLYTAPPALAETLDGSARCADYVRMEAQDMQPGAATAAARAHVTTLMHEYAPYVLRDPNGRPVPTVIPFTISYSTHYRQAHPDAMAAEAGKAVGAAEQKALTQKRGQP